MNLSKLTAWSLLLATSVFSFSCEDDDTTLVRMRVNHYVQPAIPDFTNGTSFYFVKEAGEVDGYNWKQSSVHLRNFEYELGYTYDLIVERKRCCEGMADVPNYTYTVKEVRSKTKVPDHTTFEILLVHQDFQIEKYVVQDASAFTTTNGISIQCELLCDELETQITAPAENAEVYGVFEHVNSSTIRLVQLRVEL